MHPAYLRLLLEHLERQGVDARVALGEHGVLAETGDAEQPLPLSMLQSLLPALRRISGRPWLGLEFGAAVPVFGHGPLARVAAASGSLRQALEQLVRFVALRAPALRLGLHEGGSGVRLEITEEQPLGAAREFVIEALLVMLEQLLQALSGRDCTALRHELPWPAPEWARLYPQFLAGRVRFGAPRAAVLLPPALADAPCLGADPAALAFARAECQRRLQQGANERDLLARLRRRLLACEGGYPGASAIAAEFGMAQRSFHRALQQADASYRGLLDEVRRERAAQLLKQTALPISAIAERLGYADASNFSRCVRRWFGCSARELRLGAR